MKFRFVLFLIFCFLFVGCAVKRVEQKGKCYQTINQCYTSLFGCEEEVIDEICYEKIDNEEVPVRTKWKNTEQNNNKSNSWWCSNSEQGERRICSEAQFSF